ncbi:MAG: NAD(+)--dinitrogen-reductase ADP-D-ribosyltransferase [Oceanobacter sp.]
MPTVILGSLTFQLYPSELNLDGVDTLHHSFFESLADIEDDKERAQYFQDYMAAAFLLNDPDLAGFELGSRVNRQRADYRRLLTGWLFDANAIEGAVLKGWVESRFGLLTRYHGQHISSLHSQEYERFQLQRMTGLYNTNNLEGQLDLLYCWSQYELRRRLQDDQEAPSHLLLYRGLNNAEYQEWKQAPKSNQGMLLLNNLNSFSSDPAYAETFGDTLIAVKIPLSKIVYFPDLLPGLMQGEREYLVLGGIYQVELSMVLS